MKRLLAILLLILLSFFCIIFILSYNRNIVDEECFYTIPTSYSYLYEQGKKMSFVLFCNQKESLIDYEENNSYHLLDNNSSIILNNVDVKTERNYLNKNEKYYKKTITVDIINYKTDYINDNCYLSIFTKNYELKLYLGSIRIFYEKMKHLEFNDLYGNYSYINNELHLIGLTIQLSNKYHVLNSIEVGISYGDLINIQKDKFLDSEVIIHDIKHQVIQKKYNQEAYYLTSKSNYYFIPLSYENLMLIRKGVIILTVDSEKYYIEEFIFLINNLSHFDYDTTKIKGEIKYFI